MGRPYRSRDFQASSTCLLPTSSRSDCSDRRPKVCAFSGASICASLIRRVGNLDRTHAGCAGQVAQTHRQRLASVGDRDAHIADANRVAARHADIAWRRAPSLLQPRADQPGHPGGAAGVVRAGLVRGLAVQLGGEALQRFGGEILGCHGCVLLLRLGLGSWYVDQCCTGWPAFMIRSAAPKIRFALFSGSVPLCSQPWM